MEGDSRREDLVATWTHDLYDENAGKDRWAAGTVPPPELYAIPQPAELYLVDELLLGGVSRVFVDRWTALLSCFFLGGGVTGVTEIVTRPLVPCVLRPTAGKKLREISYDRNSSMHITLCPRAGFRTGCASVNSTNAVYQVVLY